MTRVRRAKPSRCPASSGSPHRVRVPWRAMACTGNCSLHGFSCFTAWYASSIFSTPTFGSSMEFSLASQNNGRRDGMADGALFGGRPCQRDSRARWAWLLLGEPQGGWLDASRHEAPCVYQQVLVRLEVRFHGPALLLDQGRHRQHLHLQRQESAAVHCRCSRPQLHRSGLARHMGWVDSGVLGTTDGFALGNASSPLGGAVVECPYRPRLHFEVCLGEARMAQDAAWHDLPLLFSHRSCVLAACRWLQQPSLRSRLWMARQMCALPCRTSTGSMGPPRMPCCIW